MPDVIINRHDFEKLLPTVTAIVRAEEWILAASKMDKIAKDNPYLAAELKRNRGDVLALAALFQHRKRRGRLPRIQSNEEVRAAAFLFKIAQLSKKLSGPGRTRLAGMIRDGLQSDHGLASLDVELAAAADLDQRGWDVKHQDMEQQAQFDLLASNAGLETEVECKLVTTDLGRKVHRRDFFNLVNVLRPFLQSFEEIPGGHLFQVLLNDRLPSSLQVHQSIGEAVRRVTPSTLIRGSEWDVKYSTFDPRQFLLAAQTDQQFLATALNELARDTIGHSNVMRGVQIVRIRRRPPFR
jgi:hypothetical protein